MVFTRSSAPRSGFTLLESMIVVTIAALLSTILMIKYRQAVEAARYAKAKQTLQTIANEISAYLVSHGELPTGLDVIGFDKRMDPWGNPYMYLNFAGGTGNALDFVLSNGLMDPSAFGAGQSGQSGQSGQGGGVAVGPPAPADPAVVEATKRKDKFLFPLNTDYDLFCLGPNGKAWSSVAMDYSLDDVIRANDGAYFGLAQDY